jgi:hypothetical protein
MARKKTVGQVNEDTGKVETRAVTRAKTTEIPWTRGPQNWRQRAARNLWG